METPEIACCGDGHFRRLIFGIGPYIADYPEQALVTCIVQSWCPMYVSLLSFSVIAQIVLSSCTANRNDLDNPTRRRVLRNRDHTEAAVRSFELGELWQEYGIVGDIVVGRLLQNS